MRPTILYYDILRFQPAVLERMQKHFHMVSLPDPGHDTDDILAQTEISLAPLGFPFDAEKIDRCRRLKIIASSTLSIPHIDSRHAQKRGIHVCWLSEAHRAFLNRITPTAELCWGLIIAVTRRLHEAGKSVCEGRWEGRAFGRKTPKMLSRMTLGILGLGRLGSLVAGYGHAFGMAVSYYSPHTTDSRFRRCASLEQLAAESDIVSVHAHHTQETAGLIDRSFIRTMKPGSFIVNTARGEIIDEAALLEGLESGHLAGAALDVLAGELSPGFGESIKTHSLIQYARRHPNLIITPHYGGATQDAWNLTQNKTIDLILDNLESPGSIQQAVRESDGCEMLGERMRNR